MNKTSMIATIGPTCNTKEIIKQFILSGVNVFRINLGSVDHDFCVDVIDKIRSLDDELDTVSSIMFDIVGPVVKTGSFVDGSAFFTEGVKIRIYDHDIMGDCTKLYIDYFDLIDGVQYNSLIKFSNSSVVFKVLDKGSDYLLCQVLVEGVIFDNSTVYLEENCTVFLSERDRNDIIFADAMNVDFLALSYVSNVENVLDVNDLLIELGNDHISIISKIELSDAVNDIDDIIRVSDGVMVARSDLVFDVPVERIPGIQKMVINKCHYANKLSIISVDVLSSDDAFSRVQVSDIANAVLDGCDAIMLSFDEKNGYFPIDSVDTIRKVIVETESGIDYIGLLDKSLRSNSSDVTGGLAYSVSELSIRLDCNCIVCPTISGYTARKISRFRTKCPIIAISPNVNTVKSLNMYFGIYPILIDELKSIDETIDKSREVSCKYLDLSSGDKIIITGGYPFSKSKHTNFIKVEEI